jgi:hypothetical protein
MVRKTLETLSLSLSLYIYIYTHTHTHTQYFLRLVFFPTCMLVNYTCLACIVVILCVFVVLCVYCCSYLFSGMLARSKYPEGPATGQLDTGFSWFSCVYKRMLRWFPSFQVATTCFWCSPPELNFLVLISYVYICKITTAIGWQPNCS